jgi:hypothetical protein
MLKSLMDNPVFFRESRVLSRTRGVGFNRLVNAIVYPLMYVIPPLFMIITAMGSRYCIRSGHDILDMLRGCFYFSVSVQFFFILFSAMNNTQSSFAREKEQKTYDSLVSTLMTPRELYGGKLFSALYPTLATLVLYSPLFILLGLVVKCRIEGLMAVLFFSLGLALFFGIVGTFASIYCADTKKAASLVTAIVAFLILVTGFLDFFFFSLYHGFFPTSTFFPLFTLLNVGGGYASTVYSMAGPHNCSGTDYFPLFWIPCFLLMTLMGSIVYHYSIKKLSEIPGE